MRSQRASSAVLVGCLLAGGLGGCDPEPRYRREWSPLPPTGFAGRVAYVERMAATAFVIDPVLPTLRPRLYPVGKKARVAVARQGHPQLLVLAQGEVGDAETPAEPASLAVIPAEAEGAAFSLPLPGRFDALAQSEDGRFLVLHHGAEAKSEVDLLFNPNEVAVVDLEGPAGPVLTPRTLRSFGSRPLAVVFAPALAVPGVGRSLRLAVVLSDGYVTLFDLEDGARNEVSVSLALPDDPRSIRPVELLFDVGALDRDPTVFLRAQGSNDIYALRLTAVNPGERMLPGNDWKPVLSLLGAGFEPSDMALFAGGDGRARLLLVSPTRNAAVVIDGHTSAVTEIPLDAPASSIWLYEAPAPGDPQPAPRALLLGLGAGTGVGFLDLAGLEELRGRNLETRPMGAVVAAALVMPEHNLIIAQHQGQVGSGGAAGLSVIDLARRTISPLVAGDLGQVVVGAPGSDKIWVAPRFESRLGFLSLPELGAGQIRLDVPVRGLLPLGPGSDGRLRVAVDHEDPAGAVTFVDAAAPDRVTARSLLGIFYENLLDREVP